ncbi:hypothetical protein SLOPH_1757 [Spraguea lophii 42_110]|uniref:Golgi protein n=1 Tax=Spraguea lophii (strain 42_110) TaxID=1358809 RepID=S7WA82_SPRLO|nr:hypothetical protein SLOPH_1757 [Spraguea lophii 42_110]
MDEDVCKRIYDNALNLSTEIKIIGGPQETDNVQGDIINADEHETFTLEEFKKVIMDFKKNDKDFIIARVSTPDPVRQDITYSYYYIASEINKLLFKYESDRRLLHRMKVRNPLNNMYIIGQVLYYKITCIEIERAIVDFYTQKGIKRGNRNAYSAIFRTTNMINKEAVNSSPESIQRSSNVLSIPEFRHDDRFKDFTNSVKDGKVNTTFSEPPKEKLIYNAYYFASDDDFLMKGDIREYFKLNSMDPDEDFLFELDRTQNDIFALLETASDSDNESASGWKRVLTFHISLLMTMVGIILVLGANPIILLIATPIAIVIFISFLCSIIYIVCLRRSSFDTLAVRSIDDV